MAKRKVCESCGKSNAGSAAYCSECGKLLEGADSKKIEPVKALDAESLDELDMLCPHEDVMEGSVSSVTAPTMPVKETEGHIYDDGVSHDIPLHSDLIEVPSKKIMAVSISGPKNEYHGNLHHGDTITVGASAEAEFCLKDDPYVSRKHCTLRFTGDYAEIEDSGSSNGTYLRIEEATPIPNGSVILVGKHLLRIEWK